MKENLFGHENDKKLFYVLEVARSEGFEPTTLGLENRCSIQLS